MPPEVVALADLLGVDQAAFRERWCQNDGGWTVLRMDQPHCPFLNDEGGCGVYAARPMQCRAWPFWEENLGSREAWATTGAIWPGIGSGPRVEWQEAAEIARRNEEWYG